ncbi:hypothetical protein [Streptomyces chartreusis]
MVAPGLLVAGVGTSQMARAYVYQHQDDCDLVCWIPMERTDQMMRQTRFLLEFIELAAEHSALGRRMGSVVDTICASLSVTQFLRGDLGTAAD